MKYVFRGILMLFYEKYVFSLGLNERTVQHQGLFRIRDTCFRVILKSNFWKVYFLQSNQLKTCTAYNTHFIAIRMLLFYTIRFAV